VTGFPQSLLAMEQFGYPDFYLASADELIESQYADRPRLRPILDAVIDAAGAFGEIIVQARKGYVSLVTPRRTFARVQATTKNRVDVLLRLDGQKPAGRLRPSKLFENMALEIPLTTTDEVDSEVLGCPFCFNECKRSLASMSQSGRSGRTTRLHLTAAYALRSPCRSNSSIISAFHHRCRRR
jgi:hypothetical protein